jgi:hypothetical protein
MISDSAEFIQRDYSYDSSLKNYIFKELQWRSCVTMTKEEFRAAYLQAQNGLGNDIQSLVVLVSRIQELTEKIASDYRTLNQIVEKYLSEDS